MMRTQVETDDLARSVIAVPPLALDPEGGYAREANAALIRHIETGGVTTLLYGGNALAHHWPMSRYAEWLDALEDQAGHESWVIPSVGADAGRLFDQAEILRGRKFPVAMLLPPVSPLTSEGVIDALKRFHDRSGTRLIVYLKSDDLFTAADIMDLDRHGALFGVKYAVPRESGPDGYLAGIVDALGADRVISGFGEPPALDHVLDHGLAGFTAGCVCIAPLLSTRFLEALKTGNREEARKRLAVFLPLEGLREAIHPIRVLHEAVALCGLAQTGRVHSFCHSLPAEERQAVEKAARGLLEAEFDERARLRA